MTDPIDDAIQAKRDEILEGGALEEDGLILTTADAEDEEPRSCATCAHRDVCGILNRAAPMLQDVSNSEEPPIDVLDLAEICANYNPEE